MGNIFSGYELIRLGIQIEKNGRDFYGSLSLASKNKKAKEMFIYLRGEEEKHIEVFEKFLNSVREYEPPESYPGEHEAYMKALAGDIVFTKKGAGKKAAEKIKTDIQAIETAIQVEKDSILFYAGMRTSVASHDSRVVDALTEQERMHLVKLISFKGRVK